MKKVLFALMCSLCLLFSGGFAIAYSAQAYSTDIATIEASNQGIYIIEHNQDSDRYGTWEWIIYSNQTAVFTMDHWYTDKEMNFPFTFADINIVEISGGSVYMSNNNTLVFEGDDPNSRPFGHIQCMIELTGVNQGIYIIEHNQDSDRYGTWEWIIYSNQTAVFTMDHWYTDKEMDFPFTFADINIVEISGGSVYMSNNNTLVFEGDDPNSRPFGHIQCIIELTGVVI